MDNIRFKVSPTIEVIDLTHLAWPGPRRSWRSGREAGLGKGLGKTTIYKPLLLLFALFFSFLLASTPLSSTFGGLVLFLLPRLGRALFRAPTLSSTSFWTFSLSLSFPPPVAAGHNSVPAITGTRSLPLHLFFILSPSPLALSLHALLLGEEAG